MKSRFFVWIAVLWAGLAAGCGSDIKNATTAGEDAERATKDYQKQVEQGERGKQVKDED